MHHLSLWYFFDDFSYFTIEVQFWKTVKHHQARVFLLWLKQLNNEEQNIHRNIQMGGWGRADNLLFRFCGCRDPESPPKFVPQVSNIRGIKMSRVKPRELTQFGTMLKTNTKRHINSLLKTHRLLIKTHQTFAHWSDDGLRKSSQRVVDDLLVDLCVYAPFCLFVCVFVVSVWVCAQKEIL